MLNLLSVSSGLYQNNFQFELVGSTYYENLFTFSENKLQMIIYFFIFILNFQPAKHVTESYIIVEKKYVTQP